MGAMTDSTDRWHRWTMKSRFGGDDAYREQNLAEFLYPVRETVLDKAKLVPGQTLLDVGTGDGLIGFGALSRLGATGHVIFADISQGLLDQCREVAIAENIVGQCSFVLAPADDLRGIPPASVDVVTTRSVLIFVKDKLAALSEFHRVLRPGGRISLFEPINALMGRADPELFFGYDVTPVAQQVQKLKALYASVQPSGSNSMIDFDDRDLVRFAQQAGFPEVRLELQVAVHAGKRPVPWERFLRTAANPLIPTFAEAMSQALSQDESAALTNHLRPLVEDGIGVERTAFAYLVAIKG